METRLSTRDILQGFLVLVFICAHALVGALTVSKTWLMSLVFGWVLVKHESSRDQGLAGQIGNGCQMIEGSIERA